MTSGPGALPLPPGPGRLESLLGFRHGANAADYFLALTRRHGPVFRWRGYMDIYHLNEPDDVREVLTRAWPSFSKHTIDYRVLKQVLGEGLVTSDGDTWARQRRLMQPMFHHRLVNRFDAAINAATAAMAARWTTFPAGTELALERELGGLTFRIVGETLFGASVEQHAPELAQLLHATNRNPKTVQGLLTLLPWLPVPSNRRFRRQVALLDEIVFGLIAARRRTGERRDDLLGHLLAATDDSGQPAMSETQIRDEAVTLLLAGHETSATALGWTFYLLDRHPEVLARLHEELQRVLAGRPALAADLPQLPYLKQVVQESIRLYPPVWGLSRRAEEECGFGGYRIPAGAYVTVLPYTLHRHPDWWPDAERFDPERFAPAQSQGRHPFAYLPFAGGPRTCIGAGMAMLEIQLVLATLLQRFRVRMSPSHPVVPLASVTLRPRFGLKACVTPLN